MFVPYQHIDGRTLMLGKKSARFDEKTPLLHNYLAEDIAPAPAAVDYYKGITIWSEMANDTLGCCTISSKGHGLQVASLNTGGEITMTNPRIIQYYSAWDGYVPGDPSTDNGGDILTVLQKYHAQRMIGHRLLAYASVNYTNQQHVMKAIELFSDLDIGLQLPLSAQDQVGKVWDVVGDPTRDPASLPGSWGGHDVNIGKYQQLATTLMLYPITWGGVQDMTVDFLLTYCDEAYALLLGMWLDNQPDAPSGFSRAQLIADMPSLN